MKIVDIFTEELPGHLYAIILEKNDVNEFDRNIDKWTSVEYLRQYAKTNSIADVSGFINIINHEIEEIDNFLIAVLNCNIELNHGFRSLSNSEFLEKALSFQKSKFRFQKLIRIYAIKIESNCFLITGGAIKIKRTMQEHPDTILELAKLNRVKNFLITQGILDQDAISEYVFEIN